MEILECLLHLNHHVCQWLVVKFHRLTLYGKLLLVFATMTILCLPFGVRTMLQLDRNTMEQRYETSRPVMNYNNTSTTEVFYTSSPVTTTPPPTTTMPTTAPTSTTEFVKSSRKQIEKRTKSRKGTEVKSAETKDRVPARKNVLFMISDDFRAPPEYNSPDTGGRPKLHLPNIERLSSESLVLQKAYCQYSLCGPSRASLLTSRYPDTTKVYLNHVYWRESAGSFATLPQYFKENGYKTFGMGKVFHVMRHPQGFDPVSWNSGVFFPRHIKSVPSVQANWISVSEREREHQPLEDEQTISHAAKVLKRLARRPKSQQKAEPFFIGVGFYRPHVPMVCPSEFFEKYALEEGERYLADIDWQTPRYSQAQGLAPFNEGTTDGGNQTHVPDKALRELRRAYFACLSYVDHLIGVLLKVLDDEGLADSTIVSFVADHGFHLGENNVISKYTTHEVGVHVPLIIKVPGLTDGGVKSRSLVQLLDIFPTIAAAAGLPPPPPCPKRSTDVGLCVEGQSLLPLIGNPKLPLHNAVYSQVARGANLMEYSIRTDRIRYVDYAILKRIPVPSHRAQVELIWNGNLLYTGFHRQLYDLARDPNERFNLYEHPQYQAYREHLQNILMKKFSVIHDFPVALY